MDRIERHFRFDARGLLLPTILSVEGNTSSRTRDIRFRPIRHRVTDYYPGQPQGVHPKFMARQSSVDGGEHGYQENQKCFLRDWKRYRQFRRFPYVRYRRHSIVDFLDCLDKTLVYCDTLLIGSYSPRLGDSVPHCGDAVYCPVQDLFQIKITPAMFEHDLFADSPARDWSSIYRDDDRCLRILLQTFSGMSDRVVHLIICCDGWCKPFPRVRYSSNPLLRGEFDEYPDSIDKLLGLPNRALYPIGYLQATIDQEGKRRADAERRAERAWFRPEGRYGAHLVLCKHMTHGYEKALPHKSCTHACCIRSREIMSSGF